MNFRYLVEFRLLITFIRMNFSCVYLGLKFWENCNQSSAGIFNRNAETRWVNLRKLKYTGDCFFQNVKIFSSWGRALKLIKKTNFLPDLWNSTQL